MYSIKFVRILYMLYSKHLVQYSEHRQSTNIHVGYM
jgi:hypothetical protein